MATPSSSLRSLGTAPHPDTVDQWFMDQGFIRHIVGASFLGRDLVAYSSTDPDTSSNTNNAITMLYISLVHGNEPTGLLALLSTVEKLLLSAHHNNSNLLTVNLVFFPFVNIDAYLVNLEHDNSNNNRNGGCRRTNLHIDPACAQQPLTQSCPTVTRSGVDLNRNFPADWLLSSTVCSPTYGGPFPFSEPETQAIRNTVTMFQPTHFLSFHSRTDRMSGPRVLIHPYGSELRSFHDAMDPSRQAQYRKWNAQLLMGKNKNNTHGYVAGTAIESIGYHARGTTLDWMERAHGIYSYVLEVVPPHESSRWCETMVDECWEEVSIHGETAALWFELIAADKRMDGDSLLAQSKNDNGVNATTTAMPVSPLIGDDNTTTITPGRLGGSTGVRVNGEGQNSSNNNLAVSLSLLSLGLVLLILAAFLLFFVRHRRAVRLQRFRICC